MFSESEIRYPHKGKCDYIVVYTNLLNVDDWRVDETIRYQVWVNEDGSVDADFIGSLLRAARDEKYQDFILKFWRVLHW